MKKRYMPSILIVLCLLIAACVGAAYAKYASVKKAENLFFLSSNVKSKAYAAYSDTTKTLYFLNDILIDEGKTIPGTNDIATAVYTDILGSDVESVNGWIEYNENIAIVRFLGDIVPQNMAYWFENCTSLTDIYGMAEHLYTDDLLYMEYAFAGCKSLKELDLSSFDTGRVLDMNHMFSGCSNLVTIYATESFVLSDTVIRWGAKGVFEGCSALKGGADTTLATVQAIDATNYATAKYARVDGGAGSGSEGYFTLKPAA